MVDSGNGLGCPVHGDDRPLLGAAVGGACLAEESRRACRAKQDWPSATSVGAASIASMLTALQRSPCPGTGRPQRARRALQARRWRRTRGSDWSRPCRGSTRPACRAPGSTCSMRTAGGWGLITRATTKCSARLRGRSAVQWLSSSFFGPGGCGVQVRPLPSLRPASRPGSAAVGLVFRTLHPCAGRARRLPAGRPRSRAALR